MTIQKHTVLTKDTANNKLVITREFDAPLEQVWQAWTDSAILDQWWAPKPWKARTKSMEFREGGTWLYCMVGPDGPGSWCRADFESIVKYKSYTGIDAFCDEKGNITNEFPSMHWKVEFSKIGTGTRVEITITFTSAADLEKILELGFQEGFTAAHGNLDELLAG
ncbi:MAG: SRPBCC domain-containing protein [Chitinophagaceae bacterium]|nr:SRPBCC domain-containing protein [Chitinophagaceae bacterium]